MWFCLAGATIILIDLPAAATTRLALPAGGDRLAAVSVVDEDTLLLLGFAGDEAGSHAVLGFVAVHPTKDMLHPFLVHVHLISLVRLVRHRAMYSNKEMMHPCFAQYISSLRRGRYVTGLSTAAPVFKSIQRRVATDAIRLGLVSGCAPTGSEDNALLHIENTVREKNEALLVFR